MSGWLQYVAGAAFMVGLMAGGHCAAMCGGIIAACARTTSGSALRRWRLALAYSAGRIASYTIAGILAGLIGQTALSFRAGPALNQTMLLATGISMVLLALYVAGVATWVRRLEFAGSYIWRHIGPYSRGVLPADTVAKAGALGMLWGWLPCGLVYGVLLTALSTGDAVQGGVVMAVFGLGTLPNVLALGFVAAKLRRWSNRTGPRLIAATAVGGLGLFAVLLAVHPHALASDGLLCTVLPGVVSRAP